MKRKKALFGEYGGGIMPSNMQTTITDSLLGKVIFTSLAKDTMQQHRLNTFHIIETLRIGLATRPVWANTQQFVYRFDQFEPVKQVQVTVANIEQHDQPFGSTKVIACWAENISELNDQVIEPNQQQWP